MMMATHHHQHHQQQQMLLAAAETTSSAAEEEEEGVQVVVDPEQVRMMMRLYLHWGHHVQLLFRDWAPHSRLTYALSLAAVLILGLFYEWFAELRRRSLILLHLDDHHHHYHDYDIYPTLAPSFINNNNNNSNNSNVHPAAIGGTSGAAVVQQQQQQQQEEEEEEEVVAGGSSSRGRDIMYKKCWDQLTSCCWWCSDMVLYMWRQRRVHTWTLTWTWTWKHVRRWVLRHRVVRLLIVTLAYVLHSASGYLLMLLLMSFNAGVFLAILTGLGLGFFLFRINHIHHDDHHHHTYANPTTTTTTTYSSSSRNCRPVPAVTAVAAALR